MTESQSPLNSNSAAGRNLPPMPPPPPTFSTQRQMTQTLDMSTNPPVAGHRPGSPPPIPTSARPQNSSPQLTLTKLIREAYDQGYSDLHLGVGEVPRFRSRGEIQSTDYPETDKEAFMNWLREVMSEGEIQRFEEHLEFDGATQYDFARVRINIFGSLKGPAMVLRLIPLKILTMEQYGITVNSAENLNYGTVEFTSNFSGYLPSPQRFNFGDWAYWFW